MLKLKLRSDYYLVITVWTLIRKDRLEERGKT
jgi:hypothetical protein